MYYQEQDGENPNPSGYAPIPGHLDHPPGRQIADFIAKLMSGARIFRGSRSKYIYSFLGRYFQNEPNWRFMNYGYAFDAGASQPDLLEQDETERYCAQLYLAVASQVDLRGKRVLDIGSGRGGGADHIHRYLHPKSTIGLDQAQSAVEFCQRVYAPTKGLGFICGDAMDLPFPDAEFDAVTNVESSHCYPDRRLFFAGVFRTLKPGGCLLYTDFNAPGERAVDDLTAVGFDAVDVTNITPNVITGLTRDNARRETEIDANFPFGTRRAARLWAGTTGSWIFKDFQSGAREYIMYCARKPH